MRTLESSLSRGIVTCLLGPLADGVRKIDPEVETVVHLAAESRRSGLAEPPV